MQKQWILKANGPPDSNSSSIKEESTTHDFSYHNELLLNKWTPGRDHS